MINRMSSMHTNHHLAAELSLGPQPPALPRAGLPSSTARRARGNGRRPQAGTRRPGTRIWLLHACCFPDETSGGARVKHPRPSKQQGAYVCFFYLMLPHPRHVAATATPIVRGTGTGSDIVRPGGARAACASALSSGRHLQKDALRTGRKRSRSRRTLKLSPAAAPNRNVTRG